MEVLRFDSRFPSSKYAGWVNELAGILRGSPVICRGGMAAALGGGWKSIRNPETERIPENGLAHN
jgi:hypothetical protein